MLNDANRIKLQYMLEHLENGHGNIGLTVSDGLLQSVEELIADTTDGTVRELSQEIMGGGPRPNTMGLVVIRRRRQLAYSIKPSNILRYPINSARSILLTSLAGYIIPSTFFATELPASFVGFLITWSFAVLQTFSHNMSYGEAALLHKMYSLTDQSYKVPASVARTLGPSLVSEYDYVKGNNTNEVEALIQGLRGWGAIKVGDQDIELLESVQGVSPIQYFS